MGDRRWSQWDTWNDDRDVEEAGQEDHADEGGETWHAPMGADTTSED